MTKKITILDGGMGRELERMGAPFRQPEWSALALMEKSESVLEAHKNFINAGSQIITTNSYAVVPHHIGQERFDKDAAVLIKLSAELAKQAVQDTGGGAKIAGCIPPLFGSYVPEKFDVAQAPHILKPLLEEQSNFCDFWLVETVSSWQEAEWITAAIREFDNSKPLWLAYTLSETQSDPKNPVLRSGENLKETLLKTRDQIPAEAVLFNCCQPEDVLAAVKCAASVFENSSVQIGAYANAFLKPPHRRKARILSSIRNDITPRFYAGLGKKWAKAGATIIGGCCGISPDHVAALAKKLK